jgi:hypothetical protein
MQHMRRRLARERQLIEPTYWEPIYWRSSATQNACVATAAISSHAAALCRLKLLIFLSIGVRSPTCR